MIKEWVTIAEEGEFGIKELVIGDKDSNAEDDYEADSKIIDNNLNKITQ